MVMPDELPQQPHDLDVLSIELPDDPRLPVLRERFEPVVEVDFLHRRCLLMVRIIAWTA
jgi:hypothetical protein